MSHLSDDDLVLHYYREDGRKMAAAARHLRSCAQCGQAYDALSRTLRAVTAPDVIDVQDDTLELRELLGAHARGQVSASAGRLRWWQREPAAIALAWLTPALYPWSLPALFASARWAHEQVAGIALTLLALLWACAGPLLAVLVLHRVDDRFDRLSTRLRVLGAVMAAISPALFVLLARDGQVLPWYEAMAAGAVLALVPWPNLSAQAVPLRYAHRLAAVLLGVFILGHVINQSLAFVSVPAYAAMRQVMRVASQQSISYAAILTMVVLQIATGAGMGLKKARTGAVARNVRAVSGWYLAAFLVAHVFRGFLVSRPAGAAPVAASFDPPYVLASVTAAAQLPYYLLGVAAFLLHIGLYARLAALGWLAESSVRRLSYASAVVGAMVVVTVGLSLCGIHLIQ